MEDIVDDDVLPRLSLAVDGLTNSEGKGSTSFDMPSEETAANLIIKPSKTLPVSTPDPDVLEVYGWESSFWGKIRGYLGF